MDWIRVVGTILVLLMIAAVLLKLPLWIPFALVAVVLILFLFTRSKK